MAGAAYRSGSGLVDERTGEYHDYGNREDVKYTNIILPEGADAKFLNRSVLWNAVEAAEQRKDAQVAKDIILALPKELTLEQQIELARNFAQEHFVSKSLPVDLAIHDHDSGNPHAHLYVPTRRLISDRFDRLKARDLNPAFANVKGAKGFITEDQVWGERWREGQNRFFKDKDLDLRVDENYLIPQRHHGKVRSESHYVKEENGLRKEACIEIAVNDPLALLNELGRRYTVFSERDINSLIAKNTETEFQNKTAHEGLYNQKELIYLGRGDDGRKRFTTQANYKLEAKLGDLASSMAAKTHQQVPLRAINKAIAAYGLNDEQADALYHISHTPALSVLVGRAGTGKSYMLKAAKDVWDAAGLNVIGMSVSGVAAKGLEAGSGIRSNTIAYYKQLIYHDALKLTHKDVIVMDEAGMTNLHDMMDIAQAVQQAGAKLVLVGDHNQLQPIGKGAPFRAILEMIGFAEMNHIMRQVDEGDRQATLLLSQGNTEQAIAHYETKEAVHFLNTADEVRNALIDDWYSRSATSQSQLILAHLNQDVDALNIAARNKRISEGHLSETAPSYKTAQGNIPIAPNERILFLKNNKVLDVSNGDFGTVISTSASHLAVKLDRTNKIIDLSLKNYSDIKYGYAATVHKSQGTTFDNVFVYASGNCWNRFLSYVALSRHKHHVAMYSSQESYRDIEHLKKSMARDGFKDTVLDWPLSFAIRRGFDPESTIGKLINQVSKLSEKVRDKWLWLTNYEAYLQEKISDTRKELTFNYREQASIVADFVDSHRSVGKQWSAMARITDDKDKIKQLDEYPAYLNQLSQRNKLAKTISENISFYEKALKANNISNETIAKAAQKFEQNFKVESSAKRLTEINKELRDLKRNHPDAIIKNYQELLSAFHKTPDKKEKAKIEAILNDKASSIAKNKPLWEKMAKQNPQLSKLIQSRLQKIVDKSKEIERDN